MRRVVVTGLGVVSSLGNSPDAVAAALRAGRCQFAFADYPAAGLHRVPVGLAELVLGDRCRGSIRRNLSRAGEFAMAAALDALGDAGLLPDAVPRLRLGTAIGSSGEHKSDIDHFDFSDIKVLPCSIPAAIACHLGLRGRTIAIQSACTTGLSNMGFAFEQIRHGLADAYLAGAADHIDAYWVRWFTKGLLFQFHGLEQASDAMRPFAPDRRGAVLSEGAGVIVLEELEHARRRGAHAYAEVLGFHENNNGKSMYATDVEGVRACVRGCLANAALEPRDIDYVNPHGAATPSGDAVEAEVLRSVFPEPVPVSATKAMNGHSMAAASAHELVHCLLMLRDDFIAPSINCPRIAPECRGINLVTRMVPDAGLGRVLCLNAGFGGVNAAMIVGRCS